MQLQHHLNPSCHGQMPDCTDGQSLDIFKLLFLESSLSPNLQTSLLVLHYDGQPRCLIGMHSEIQLCLEQLCAVCSRTTYKKHLVLFSPPITKYIQVDHRHSYNTTINSQIRDCMYVCGHLHDPGQPCLGESCILGDFYHCNQLSKAQPSKVVIKA